MTTLPAAVFGLKDRGQLRAGAFADILIFDLSKVNDAATYEKPHQLSEGIDDIIVNGELARRNGSLRLRLPAACCGRNESNQFAISSSGSASFTPSTQISYSNTIPALQLWLILRFA
jgi:N-acyl-D-aspartate/D-glutamate deacylase